MVHRGGQQDAVGFDAGGDDAVDAVVIPDAAEASGVEAVVAGHAGADVGAGLEDLEVHAGGLHLPAHGLQALGGVAVFAGTSVDGDNFHKGASLLLIACIVSKNGGDCKKGFPQISRSISRTNSAESRAARAQFSSKLAVPSWSRVSVMVLTERNGVRFT